MGSGHPFYVWHILNKTEKAEKQGCDHISNWDVSKVTEFMFSKATVEAYSSHPFNDDLSCWDTSRVTTMEEAFDKNPWYNQPMGCWDTAKVTTMTDTFAGTNFNQDISAWDTAKVQHMDGTFSDATKFDQDISAWDVSKVEDMSSFLENAKAFNQPLGSWSFLRDDTDGCTFAAGSGCPLPRCGANMTGCT